MPGRHRDWLRCCAMPRIRRQSACAATRPLPERSTRHCVWNCFVKREQLEHLLRAAGAVTGSRRLIVIGSQSILGSFADNAPLRALVSREADSLPLDAPDKADVISVVLGELSPFDQTFGYFGDGVSFETATLPNGWRDPCADRQRQYQWLCRALSGSARPADFQVFRRTRKRSRVLFGPRRGRLGDAAAPDRAKACTDIDTDARERVARMIQADFSGRGAKHP